jgi:hypothetical protein
MYTEMKATTYPAFPQSLVLEGLKTPEDYILEVNRAHDQFGLPYSVPISIPNEEIRKKLGLQAINVSGKYPAQAAPNKQMKTNYSIIDEKTFGDNPFPLQRDKSGSSNVDYSVDYVFKSGEEWEAEKNEYNQRGNTESGMIVAMPESILDFLKFTIQLQNNFVWNEADQVIVTFTSTKWKGEKRRVFRKGGDQSQELRIRYDIKYKDEPINYEVKIMSAGNCIHKYGPEAVLSSIINIRDRFARHIPIKFQAHFDYDSADIFCTYEDDDNNFYWETDFKLENGKSHQIIVPTIKDVGMSAKGLKISYDVTPSKGDSYSGETIGRKPVVITK